jgi:SAM-dependent methyltransferase
LTQVQARQREVVLGRIRDGSYHWELVGACLCGSDDATPVSEKDRFGIPVGVVVCTRCGLLRTSPRLASEDLPEFYDLDYHALHMGIDHPEPSTALVRAGQGSAIFDYVRPYLGPGPIVVAEIGAGTGGVLREFAEAAGRERRAVDLIGCEYARSFVDVARAEGTDVRFGGVEALLGIPPPDLLIMSHVLEHFADPALELARVRMIVRSGTLVYIEVPGVKTLHTKAQYGYDLLQYLTLAHTYHFTLATLDGVMRRAGFRMLAGDEEVRSVFVPDDRAIHAQGATDLPSEADEVLGYLAWLDRSPRIRTQRAMLGIRRSVKGSAKSMVRVMFGEPGVARARRLRRTIGGSQTRRDG